MKILKYIIGIGFIGLICTSCVKDDDYTAIPEGNKVELDGFHQFDTKSGDTLLIQPKFKYLDNRDTSIFEYTWYIDGKEVHKGRNYKFTSTELKKHIGFISARNTKNNVSSDVGDFWVDVTSAFEKGYYVLYEENNQTKLGVVNPLYNSTIRNFEYKVTEGAFEAVNGEVLHPDSYRLQVTSTTSGVSGMMIMTQNGHGSRTIDPKVAKHAHWLDKEFSSGTFPKENFSPVGVLRNARSMVLIDAEGQAYLRALPKNVAATDLYAIPYSNTPVYIEGIGNDYSFTHGYQDPGGTYRFLYNRKGNYLMYIYYWGFGGRHILEFRKFPHKNTDDLPVNYSPLDDFGDMELVHIGYSGSWTSGYSVILKDQSGNYYHQVFKWTWNNTRIDKEKDGRIPFMLDANDDTEFMEALAADYTICTGGANNDKIYFIDLSKRSSLKTISVKEFASFDSKITSISQSEHYPDRYLLVGFENGDFKVFNISNPDFNAVQIPVFEHTFGNKVKDVVFNQNFFLSW